MESHEAFMEAIHERPDEDADRLVYADWLDDQGDEARAEFIRVQCYLAQDEKARMLEPLERLRLKEREADLLEAHKDKWAGAAADYEPEFRRGFVERVTLDLLDVEACAKRLQDLRDAMPTITGLKVAPWAGVSELPFHFLERLLDHDACKGLRELDLEGCRAGNNGAEVVAEAKKPALERLNMEHCFLSGAGYAALAASPHLKGVKELNLAHNPLLFEREVFPAAFPALEALNLENTHLDVQMLRLFAAAPWMRNLRRLELGGNQELDDDAIAALTDSGEAFKLRKLGMNCCGVRQAGAEMLARSAQFPELESLSLGNNFIGKSGVRALAASPHLGKLEMLDISDMNIGVAELMIGCREVKALIDSPGLGRLHSLKVSDSGAFGPGLGDLANSEGLARLRSLDISGNSIGDTLNLRKFLASPHLRQLRELDLSHNPLRLAGARALANTPNLPVLRGLKLYDCDFGVEGVRAIAECTGFERCRHLDIGSNLPAASRLQFAEGASSAVGAVEKLTLGMRAQLNKNDPRHVTVEEARGMW